MKLTWLPEHSVGIGVLDLQHQQIISLCNKAHDAIEHDDEYLLHEIINDLMLG